MPIIIKQKIGLVFGYASDHAGECFRYGPMFCELHGFLRNCSRVAGIERFLKESSVQFATSVSLLYQRTASEVCLGRRIDNRTTQFCTRTRKGSTWSCCYLSWRNIGEDWTHTYFSQYRAYFGFKFVVT